MKRVQPFYFLAVLFLVPLLLQISCGSSGSSDDGEDDDVVAVSDLSALPNLDLDAVDLTSGESINAAPALRSARQLGEIGDDSGPGCMAVEFFKPFSLLRLKQGQSLSCYVDETQAGASGDADATNDVAIPTGSYGYYEVTVPMPNDEPSGTVRTRLGNFGGTFKMDVCEQDDSGNYVRTFEYNVTGNLATNTWSGFVTDHPPEGDIFMNSAFTIVMDSAGALQAAFDFTDVSSANTSGYFGINPSADEPGEATTYDEATQVNFAYDSATTRNTVSGSRSLADESGLIYSQYDADFGAARLYYAQEGEVLVDGTDGEAYNPNVPAGDDTPPVIIDSSGVSFYDAFLAQDLPTAVTEADVNTNTAFTEDWNCEAPAGSSFVEINGLADGFDYDTCVALMEEANSVGDLDAGQCFGDQGGGDGGGGGGGGCTTDQECQDVVSAIPGADATAIAATMCLESGQCQLNCNAYGEEGAAGCVESVEFGAGMTCDAVNLCTFDLP